MAVRNFWIEANIDGRETVLKGGPASKRGGLYLTIKQRSEGGITTAYKIRCSECNGELCTYVEDNEGKEVARNITLR